MRIDLATCSEQEMRDYVKAREPYVTRAELIFAAGALNNRKLEKSLGSAESARWMEGRRAADPAYENIYYR